MTEIRLSYHDPEIVPKKIFPSEVAESSSTTNCIERWLRRLLVNVINVFTL